MFRKMRARSFFFEQAKTVGIEESTYQPYSPLVIP